MVSPSEAWTREYKEASKLADEIDTMFSDASSLASTGPQTQRHFSAARRKIAILKAKVETLEQQIKSLTKILTELTEEVDTDAELFEDQTN